ncbi:MAG: hypothetical protein AAF531_26935, partial [Actinomycetota bacterium]
MTVPSSAGEPTSTAELQRFPGTDTDPAAIVAAVAQDGAAIVERLLGPDRLLELQNELDPIIDASAFGKDGFVGRRTRRSGALLAHAPSSHEIALDPVI